jgi:5-oxopent-3-ene-1,2,5-tricarboxylate decarboxylase/2-hydroxyhepta-2,4-diene-1,7-dioate isomerase
VSSVERALSARLRTVPTSTAETVLRALGVERFAINALRLLAGAEAIAGPARTLRFLPARADFVSPKGKLQRGLIDSLREGEVLVIDALGTLDAAALGDMLAGRAKALGAAGVVVDGVVRDVAGLRAMGLTVHARGAYPTPSPGRLMPWECDVPIQCGGVLIFPGDYVIADLDGVVVVPAAFAEEVARRGQAMNADDAISQRLLAEGKPLDEAYTA